jgi:hypothetical protein
MKLLVILFDLNGFYLPGYQKTNKPCPVYGRVPIVQEQYPIQYQVTDYIDKKN